MINQTTSISVVFFKIYFIISYQSKSLSVTPPLHHVCSCTYPEKVIGFSGSEVTGSCKILDDGVRNRTLIPGLL